DRPGLQVKARIIYSFDELRGVGLLDVLPKNASKLHALQWLMNLCSISIDEVVFSGDSGNDLEVLASTIPAVLVANATDEVKALAQQLANQAGSSDQLYLAQGGFQGMNGCYSAGILEGIAHYHPGTIGWMSHSPEAKALQTGPHRS